MRKILLVNDTRLVGHHGSSAVVDVILQEFEKREITVESDLRSGMDVENVGDHGCGAVVINGEGAMHGGGKHSHAFSRIGERMRERGVPVFLINTVFDEDTPQIVMRMQHFTAIYCREAASVERLRMKGVVANLCPDLTFGLELPPGLFWRPGEKLVILDTTVSSKNRMLHKFSADSGITFQPIRASPQLLRVTSSRNLLRIVRFNVTKAIGKLFSRSYRFNRYANAVTARRDFLRRISDGTRVVVAARFHGVCFCMKLGVPFLAIASNTPKIEGLLADAGLLDRMLDITDLDVDVIQSRCDWGAQHEERRRSYVEGAQLTIARMFDDIAGAVR